ncbi:MAG: hypothetical protein MJZ30_01560 [Paludibacteraceae bacterium]|nr:hypothetical protein [Paludibacteraceae bacterium]
MNPKTVKVIEQLALIMVLIMAVSIYTIKHLFVDATVLMGASIVVPLFFLCYGSMTFFVLDKTRENAMQYSRMFLVLKVSKMFIALFNAVVFCLVNREWAVPFLAVFAIIYVIYTVFEAIALTKLK